jgi:alpha-amylase
MNNITLFQFFHWYYPNDCSLWKFCAEQAPFLKKLGVTYVWLPPATKSANGKFEPGYAVYDLFDLGEFDQKGSIPTKYGTKDEYIACIKALHKQDIKVLADAVLNHKMGADEKELVKAKMVIDTNDRRKLSETEEAVEAYTRFTFPARQGKYSQFIWDWRCFTGFSVGTNEGERIYSIINEYGHDWEEILDPEFGNFDYLMGSDIEFRNEHVRAELKWWAKWYIETTGVDGFRLDAVKHISHHFMREWIEYVQEIKGDAFILAEYLTGSTDLLVAWNNAMDNQCQLFDIALHNKFYEASLQKENYNLAAIFDNTLVQRMPERAVTFVDSHDSQPFQALESFVDYWFKPLANAFILLRVQGIPCVFYPSIYGAQYEEMQDGKSVFVDLAGVLGLREMMMVRHHLSYGQQRDYFDHNNVVGWTREGVDEHKHSGCAVLVSNGDDGFKMMEIGKRHANAQFIDILRNREETITTDENGAANFTVKAKSASVWIRKEAENLVKI